MGLLRECRRGEPDDAADGTTDDDGTATTATKRDAATEVLRKGHHREKMEDSGRIVVPGAADNRFASVRRLGRGKSVDGRKKTTTTKKKTAAINNTNNIVARKRRAKLLESPHRESIGQPRDMLDGETTTSSPETCKVYLSNDIRLRMGLRE